MVFKVADGHLTSFIGKLKETSVVSSQLSDNLSNYVDEFNNFLDDSNGSLSRETFEGFIENVKKLNISEVTQYFTDLAESGEFANANLSDLFSTIIGGNTHGFQNVRNIIHTFNNEFEHGSETQTAFVRAVGQSNQQLGNYLSGLNGATASMGQYGKQLAVATAKTIGLQAATMALNAVVGLVINWAISGIMEVVNRQKELAEAAREAAETARDEVDAIQDLLTQYSKISEEYKTDKSKKEDLIDVTDQLLEKLGYEKTTIEELIEKYGDLDTALNSIIVSSLSDKIDTMYVELSNSKNALTSLADKYKYNVFSRERMRNRLFDSKGWEIDNDIFNAIAKSGLFKVDVYYGGYFEFRKENDSVENILANIQDIEDAIALINRDFWESDFNESPVFKELVTIRDELNNAVNDYNSWANQINDTAALKAVKESLIGREIPKTKEELEAFKQEIIDTYVAGDKWKQNKFTNSVEDAEKAIEKCLRSVPEFKKFFDVDIPDGTDQSKIKLTDLTKVITELGEEMEEFIDTADKFGEAIGKIISGENLDFSEIFELVQLVPELAKEIQKVNGGKFTIDPEILFKAAVEYGKNNNPITQDIENSKKTIEEIKKQIQELESTNGHGWEFENARGTLKNQLRDETEHLETLENLFEIYGDSLNSTLFDEALDGIKDSVDDYNKKIEKAQNAIEKMNDGTALTYDELLELEELFPQISKSATEGTDGYYLQIDVLNDLMDASYEERNAFIQNQIDKTQALAEQTRKQLADKETSLETLKYLDTKYRNGESCETTKETQAEVDDLNAALKKYDDTLSLLNAMLGNLYETSGANAKSEKDKLQEEIDYYDILLSAIEKIADKRKEQLEKEKDALQKQKDALSDANDERQRELDLIEARNNLENAKKRKVYVYTEGYGFRQTQDEKAVKEAEKELNDVELEIQEADIDKQIDKLDEQIEAFEDYVKQFSDMKSNIEDLITIEKAKNALDLDEQGLLNLPSETAKEIQEGLANALLEKDKEDNKENTKYNDYGNIVADNILKKIGSPLSFKEFAEKWDAVNNVGIPDYSKYVNGSAGNSEVYNNSTKNVTFAPNITVYGGSSEQEIADIAVREFENIYKSAFNAIK